MNSQDHFVRCPVCFENGIDETYCFKCKEYHDEKEHKKTLNSAKRWAYRLWNGKTYGSEDFVENKEGKKMAKKLGLETKNCPGCSMPVAKDENCNHVTCPECGEEFNWAKQRKWKGYTEEYRRNAVF